MGRSKDRETDLPVREVRCREGRLLAVRCINRSRAWAIWGGSPAALGAERGRNEHGNVKRGEPVYVIVIRNPSAAALEQELGG